MARKKSKTKARANKAADDASSEATVRSVSTAPEAKSQNPVNMARNRGATRRKRGADNSSTVIAKYDMELSSQRPEKEGYHPDVTSKSRQEMLEIGGALMQRYWQRPTSEQFFSGEAILNGSPFIQPRSLTRAWLISRKPLGMYPSGDDKAMAGAAATENKLARILNTPHIGGLVSDFILASGQRSVLSVALTSSQSWAALVASSRIWDFFAADFCSDGPASAFIVVTPEYTVGEIAHCRKFKVDQERGADDPVPDWFAEAIKAEKHIYASISRLHQGQRSRRKTKPRLGFLAKELHTYSRHLLDIKHIGDSDQFSSGPEFQVFEAPAHFALTRLNRMTNAIHQKRASIKVLHFQKTPFLDRRMLAVILRSCQHAEMIGIYDCPLIHFGDVLCLLDLIHEVNRERRGSGLPAIKAFDFSPRFHGGMPLQDANAETYGLTWGPENLEVVQRGFFSIVLKAFLKARRMKLDLLFTKGQAFCSFLYKVPNYTLAVVSFLDALHRFLGSQRSKDPNVPKQALYDLLKPVRLGLEKVDQDWPDWYTDSMGDGFLFCSSCGYEMLQQFFTSRSLRDPALVRVCAGCLLGRELNMESDHLKQEKKEVLDTLFPKHDSHGFNQDAPLAAGAQGLMRLKSTECERPPAPLMTANALGEEYLPHYVQPLLRDNKLHLDSLQGLPSLSDLVGDGELAQNWSEALVRCLKLDMYSRLIRRVREVSKEGSPGWHLCQSRVDGGWLDHVAERQPPRLISGWAARLSHSFSSVVGLEKHLYDKNWL